MKNVLIMIYVCVCERVIIIAYSVLLIQLLIGEYVIDKYRMNDVDFRKLSSTYLYLNTSDDRSGFELIIRLCGVQRLMG